MLKLFKYNWKKSEILFYSLLGITVLVLAIMFTLTKMDIWWDEVSIFGAITLISFVLQVLTIIVIYNFNATLKSITRRMLPISALKEYVAYIAIPVLYNIVFFAIIWLFILLLNPTFQLPEVNQFVSTLNIAEVTISLLVFCLLYSVLSAVMYFFAVAVTRLFKTNLRILIFIAISFVLSIVYGLGLNLLQGGDPATFQQGLIRLNYNEISDTFNIDWFSFSWLQLVEIAISFILAYITIYIIKHKIEV